ncbi:MAG: NADH-dependent [FeFe] hydrogenase, group A6 [Oscillospiraceae bacterium]|nr:NADH-dependent [FeFe] hydrogenase, group A6 [Oscillospiraceae bacterium]MCL2278077.1 NADH-dependent [FeFe] hydrogenase, group A6 [Oscillospiraceae bacterium]
MDMINLTINGVSVKAPKGSTVLEAAKYANIEIPTLCYLKDLNEIGACRICLAEVKGARSLVAACVHPAEDGMEVQTNTPEIRESRRHTLELTVSNHKRECLSCQKSETCQLLKLCKDYGIDEKRYGGITCDYDIDNKSSSLSRDNTKCVLCRRCVAACKDQQSIAVIDAIERGFKTHIGCAFEKSLEDAPCVYCGQCIVVCPTGALREKDDTQKVLDAIADPEKTVYVFTAPAIRATLGEAFGMPLGTNVEGKLAAVLKRMGFDGVYDMALSADLTIMEEAHEFLDRVKNGGKLPIITSCSPGWVKFCEHYYPDLTENLSSCKSPQQMFGATLKTYFAKKNNLDPKNVVVVSVVPCTSKKFEAGRDDESAAGVPDVDVAITTRELARMIKADGVDFAALEDAQFDSPFGTASGAGVIFGVTGGVLEAALRTASYWLDKNFEVVNFSEVRGPDGVRRATYKIAGMEVKVAAASGLANARTLLDAVKSGKEDFHMIEIMACPGGCINGGGQPDLSDSIRNNHDVIAARTKVLYELDEKRPLRKSYENLDVQKIYDEYLEKPGSHKAHDMLHTKFVKRTAF